MSESDRPGPRCKRNLRPSGSPEDYEVIIVARVQQKGVRARLAEILLEMLTEPATKESDSPADRALHKGIGPSCKR